ncbi:serine hydrolase [Streptomyces sp. JJ36]|uniref:serine hydrolase domain-containing protein n=1 Tax=Streptomyces sp. JJ36 TaxID=2736645 RepID=UPI001F198656|nr:serine hydrolase domain-containing protein [Streptomyces sp. JJ36]MCF6526009.1 beta-lactamase family protein [Streptomyces sp. JJ36]
MSPRNAAVGPVAAVVVLALSVTSSSAADRGHAGTQRAMDALVAQARVPGVLGQAEDGGGMWHGASGVADRSSGRPRLAGDRFRIGSVTKTFVATVLLQLEAEGRLDLDDPVERWLPGRVRGNGHDGRRITVRALLNHTSGVADFTADPGYRRLLGPGFLPHRYETHRPGELVRRAMRHPPLFPPGTGWAYSNTNYVLAGMVVEAVTGRGYAAEIERRVLRPLGLRRTTLPGTSPVIRGRHGRAYSALPGGGTGRRAVDVTRLDPSLAGAAGEMVSTTGDLLVFLRELLGGRLLPPRQLAAMTDTVPTGGRARFEGYGLGLWSLRLSCGTRVWGHDGDIHGSGTTAVTTRDGTHTAVFNRNGDWAADRDTELLEAEYCQGRTGPSGAAPPRTPAAPGRPRPSAPCAPRRPAAPATRTASPG